MNVITLVSFGYGIKSGGWYQLYENPDFVLDQVEVEIWSGLLHIDVVVRNATTGEKIENGVKW